MKSSFLLSFLESVPDVAAKLQEPSTRECKFENVVKSAEQAAVLVLVYIEDLAWHQGRLPGSQRRGSAALITRKLLLAIGARTCIC